MYAFSLILAGLAGLHKGEAREFSTEFICKREVALSRLASRFSLCAPATLFVVTNNGLDIAKFSLPPLQQKVYSSDAIIY